MNIITVPGPSCHFKPEPVYHLEGTGPVVFFTFNILWEKEHLPAILEILEEHEIKAVFFVTGEWLKKYPVEAQKITEYGHELGNRTYSQSRLLLIQEEKIVNEIESFNKLSQELLGYYPQFFRPPYGEYNTRIVRIAMEEDCITLLWSINVLMLSTFEDESIISRFEERLHDGAILLFHTVSPKIENILPEIIAFIKWKGYSIGPPELILEQVGK
jgi:peptidoglycan-N-acetylglucosamine deacetylase